jgi:tetratricopeptide (TPR) repeat protein
MLPLRWSYPLLASALLSMASVPIARADAPSNGDEREAVAAMEQGVALFGQGDAQGALAKYERAKQLAPNANAPYRYAAEAELALDRPRRAVENLEQYLAKNPAVSDADDVRSRIARIRVERYPAILRIECDAPGARARFDGGAAWASLPVLREVRPGQHVVTVVADGHDAVTRTFDLLGDTQVRWDVTLIARPATDMPTRAAIPWRTLGWVGAGVGGAGLITVAVLDATVLAGAFQDLDAAQLISRRPAIVP